MTLMAVEARANNQCYLKHQVSLCNLYFFFVIFSFCLVYLIPLNNSAVYMYTLTFVLQCRSFNLARHKFRLYFFLVRMQVMADIETITRPLASSVICIVTNDYEDHPWTAFLRPERL